MRTTFFKLEIIEIRLLAVSQDWLVSLYQKLGSNLLQGCKIVTRALARISGARSAWEFLMTSLEGFQESPCTVIVCPKRIVPFFKFFHHINFLSLFLEYCLPFENIITLNQKKKNSRNVRDRIGENKNSAQNTLIEVAPLKVGKT